jgi:hypothetical protein
MKTCSLKLVIRNNVWIELRSIEFSMGQRMIQLFRTMSRYSFGARSLLASARMYFADMGSARCVRGQRKIKEPGVAQQADRALPAAGAL